MTREARAQLAWQVLAGAAANRQILTYTLLAERIGMGAGTLSEILGCIMYYCDQNGLPPLTVLVVRQDSGVPGEGLTTLENLGRDREAVFGAKWFEMLPPSAAQFAVAFRRGEESRGGA